MSLDLGLNLSVSWMFGLYVRQFGLYTIDFCFNCLMSPVDLIVNYWLLTMFAPVMVINGHQRWFSLRNEMFGVVEKRN